MAIRGPVLVGRRQEVDLVRATLTGAESGAVVLGGQAGVGKTRLAQEVATAWQADGHEVVWVDGAAGRSAIPFGAVARLLSDEPVVAPDFGPRDVELIRAAVSLARRHPQRLIAVDDGHELDDLSALLVHHLVLDRAAPIIMTVRSGEAVPDALASLWRNGHVQRIDVLPLSESETRDLVGGLLGDDVDPSTVEALCRVSEGNALLLGELIHDSTESGNLRRDGTGRWQWDGSVGRARHLQEAVESRLRHLDEEGRRLLLVLALGEPVAVESVRRLVPEVDLAGAEQRSLIRTRTEGSLVQVHLGHPLLGEVLLAQASPATLRSVRLALADELAAMGSRRGSDGRLEAQLRLDAGDGAHPDHLLWAAIDALLVGAGDRGRRLAEAALAAGAPVIAQVVLGESLLLGGRDDEAIEVVEAALTGLDRDADRVRAAHILQHAHHRRGDADGIDEVFARTEPLVVDPVWRAVLEGNGIQLLMMSGRTHEGWERAEALLAQHDDPLVRLRLVSSVGSGRALGGRTTEALDFVAGMMADALRLQDDLPLAPVWVANANAIGLLLAGRLHDAVGFIAMLRTLESSRTGAAADADPPPWLSLFAGRIDLARGDAAAAARLLGAAADGLGPGDLGGFYPWARSLHAEALALTGDLEAAHRAAMDAVARPSRMQIYDGEARRARAWVAAQRGELTRAVDELVALAGEQRAERQHGLEVYTLHDAV
ncbi:MAG: LuxR family transcriptional regulator, partial [Acidimicrobiales bacterium]|nr:LuxR family transcriptional regulator [Acidimicrobiales bacterium]